MPRFSRLQIILLCVTALVAASAGVGIYVWVLSRSLPEIMSVADYKPLLVSEVFARGNEKIGEFTREARTLIPYEKIPKRVVQAFTAAEDETFFEHDGINYLANLRALLTNLKSGKKAQGASTITQQVARSLLLSREKTYSRKIKEILLSYKMEEDLSKEDILYLYLNQIYFGAGAYGIVAAADTYFRKKVEDMTLAEIALLAGLPKAPHDYSPVRAPQAAKDRQRYVLRRMSEVGHVTKEEAEKAIAEPIRFYATKEFNEVAPYFVETVRQVLFEKLGEKVVLDDGIKIYTSIDVAAQTEANNQVRQGLEEVDKRQGYRGALKNLKEAKDRADFFLSTRKALMAKASPIRVIKPDGNFEPERPLEIFHQKDAQGKIVTNIPPYIKKGQRVEALVTKVDDKLNLAFVQFAEGLGALEMNEMLWARKPDASTNYDHSSKPTKPSQILKEGDVIYVKVVGDKFASPRLEKEFEIQKKANPNLHPPDLSEYAHAQLDQEPQVQGALVSFDQKTQEVIAMVGGYDFEKQKFNRAIQAQRQTGSSFKTIVYAAALDKGFTGATPIVDAPVVYEEKDNEKEGQDTTETIKKWKPHNHGEKFSGDTLFRTALVRSLNIPTIKILENVGVSWVIDYARRLGMFSPLNNDLSLGLGSSSVTLYEMTKAFSHFGRLGRRIRPVIIHKVVDRTGKEILGEVSLDVRFEKEITEIDQAMETRRKDFLQTLMDEKKNATAALNASNSTGHNSPGSHNPSDRSPQIEKAKAKTPKIFFDDPDQLISNQTAYIMTTLLQGTIMDEGGTAGRARALGRPAAGKTGTTNGYFDAWFVGFTPQVASGVWVGFDQEKSLGAGEVGGRAALPIWVDYMKAIHKDQPVATFPIPEGIVFANIDSQTGKLASVSSKHVINQAFIQGTEPTEMSGSSGRDEGDFYKEDLAR